VGIRGEPMVIKLIILAILVEALVELFFKAAPLQGTRKWIISKTPFLVSEEQGHLFECKYCTSFWVGVFVVFVIMFFDNVVTRTVGFIIVVARLSNLVHIVYGIIKDAQMNMRLGRK
jgi:ABC-type amino acid transport system permease subunit